MAAQLLETLYGPYIQYAPRIGDPYGVSTAARALPVFSTLVPLSAGALQK